MAKKQTPKETKITTQDDSNELILPNDTPTPKKKIKGLGDVISTITKAVGIEPCGDCEERRKKLNEFFPFTRIAKRELIEQEVEMVLQIKQTKKVEDIIGLFMLYNEIFGANGKPCKCPGVISSMVEKLIIQIEFQNIK